MKALLALMFIYGCISCSSGCGAVRADLSSPNYVNYISERTVLIRIDCPDDDRDHRGTGVIMAGDRILTVGHVVANSVGCQILVRREGEQMQVAHILKQDKVADWAVVVVPSRYSITTSLGPVKLGLPIACAGYPVQYTDTGTPYLSYTEGLVSTVNVKDVSNGIHYHRVTAYMWAGSSGGGCFDREGRLIGLSRMLYADAQGYFYILRSSDLGRTMK